jgi:phasin protein
VTLKRRFLSTADAWTRWAETNMELAGAATVASELAVAAGVVIGHRVALGAAALQEPLTADAAEFARMGPEKLDAFGEAGSALFAAFWAIGEEINEFLETQTRATTQLAFELGLTPTPVHAISAQARYLMETLDRAGARGASMAACAVGAGSAALRPLHRRATANARRLSRKGSRKQR